MKRVLSLLILLMLMMSCGNNNRKINLTAADLKTGIRNLLEIPVYEHIYRDVIYIGEDEHFLFFNTVDKRLLFSIDIKVQAGIDFSDGLQLVQGENGLVTVFLPPAKILLIDADESTINQFFLKEKGGDFSRLDYYDEIGRQKEMIKQDAIDRGILVKAYDNGKNLIKNLLKIAGYSEIVFIQIEQSVSGEENG